MLQIDHKLLPHPDHVGADDDWQQGQPVTDEVELGDDRGGEHGVVVAPLLASDAVGEAAFVDLRLRSFKSNN